MLTSRSSGVCLSLPVPLPLHSPLPGPQRFQQVAQKTDANQLCRTLLVSDKARVTVMPSMEIIANDVKCTHGATICDLEDEELFYLMSRGISKIQVRFAELLRRRGEARESPSPPPPPFPPCFIFESRRVLVQ